MAKTAGFEDQINFAADLDDEVGCGFVVALFISGVLGGVIFGVAIIS